MIAAPPAPVLYDTFFWQNKRMNPMSNHVASLSGSPEVHSRGCSRVIQPLHQTPKGVALVNLLLCRVESQAATAIEIF
jgi:hypothetical protein